MALFGKLFEKKECAICGGEIGLLGNRKLEDGNMCKNCAGKLSPWFSERRHSTVEQIKQQLSYRAQNEQALAGFNPTRIIGGNYYKVYVEEVGGIPSRMVVTSNDDCKAANPDIIYLKDVAAINTDISDSYRELKRKNEAGEMVSYNPPRYEYSYDFYMQMRILNNPYFDEIRFRLNPGTVIINGMAAGGVGRIFSASSFDPSYNPEYRKYMQMCEEISALLEKSRQPAQPAYAAPVPGQYQQPYTAPAQTQYTQPAPVQPAAPPRPKFCPGCGAPTDETGKFCQFCGTKL